MENRKKIALLIDYDNFNQEKFFPILLEELNEIGDVLIKQAYYSNLDDKTIKDKFIKWGLEPMSQLAYKVGKNAVDIRITIEAMALLNKDYVDTICLATNDSDFTPLVYTLQKNNKYVIGAGDNKATETYKNACNNFISVEKIIVSTGKAESTPEKEALSKLIKMVNEIIESNHGDEGYADFSWVILTLKNRMKDFSPNNYGSKNKQSLQFFKMKLKEHYTVTDDAPHRIRVKRKK